MSDDKLRTLRARVEATTGVFEEGTEAYRFGEYVLGEIDALQEDSE